MLWGIASWGTLRGMSDTPDNFAASRGSRLCFGSTSCPQNLLGCGHRFSLVGEGTIGRLHRGTTFCEAVTSSLLIALHGNLARLRSILRRFLEKEFRPKYNVSGKYNDVLVGKFNRCPRKHYRAS